MKNKDWGRGRGGLNREEGLINFPPLKRGGLLERGTYLRGGGGVLIEDLRYTHSPLTGWFQFISHQNPLIFL